MPKPSTTRMRHEQARRRKITVAEKRFLTPNYLQIRFDCDDFADFFSASWDDHIKVFLQGGRSASGRPPMRDYTPRWFDAEKGEFIIEFALHADPGPATSWARDCTVGDVCQIGGPRGSVIVSPEFDWYWMIGDETAIPAISRHMLEQPEAQIHAVIAVANEEEEVPLPASPNHLITWAHRPVSEASDPASLENALSDLELPQGDGFVWIAAEAAVAKAMRENMLAKGHPLSAIKARGYWVFGKSDTTAKFD